MEELYDLKILAVDDEARICNLIGEILSAAGFRQIQTAQSCAEARQAFSKFQPDAVVLDVMLPDGDGFALMQEFRRATNVPILFLSARDADDCVVWDWARMTISSSPFCRRSLCFG